MLILKRLLVYLQPLFVISVFSLLFLVPTWYYYLLGLSVLAAIFSLWYLIGSKVGLKDFFYFLLTPVLVVVSGFVFFVFLERIIVESLLILIISYFIFIFYNKIFFEFYKKPIWQLKAFYHLLFYLQLISLWFFSSAIFGLIIFVNLNVYLAIGIMALSALLFFGQFCWISEISSEKLIKKNKVPLGLSYFIFLVLFTEAIFFLKILPLTYYFKGFGLTAAYYLFCQTFFFSCQENLVLTKKLKINFFIIFILLVLIIFTGLLISQ